MSLGTRPCRRCGIQIRFVKTINGKTMPLDINPDPNGNVVILDGVARVLTTQQRQMPAVASRWMPHKVTCNQGSRDGPDPAPAA